ncbi:MAG: leucyl aminopeptidase [Microbacteriaceae bacterium]
MTAPRLTVTTKPVFSIEADVLVIGVRKTDSGPELLTEIPEICALQPELVSIGVTGSVDELTRLPRGLVQMASHSLALIGVGNAEPGTSELRYASGSAARQLRPARTLAFALPTSSDEQVLAVLEGAGMGAYDFNDYRVSTLASQRPSAGTIVVAAQTQQGGELAARAAVVTNAIHTVRDLVNTPPSELYPESFADIAVALGRGISDVTTEVLTEVELAEGGYGGLLAVGAGSTRGPRLVRIEYSPAGATTHIALVGKGITFDSGGLSLKPPASMIGMKYDMTGAATVLAVVIAAAQLGVEVKLTGWLCLAENMPSGTAARPGDVLRIRGGKTVEYLNTDAEGRIVLADGIAAASEEQPDAIVDVATLTGAARIALGNRYVGIMGDSQLVDTLTQVASGVGELLWPMPMPGELRALLNSDIADITNIKAGSTAAGMLIAAVFLREFVGQTGEGSSRKDIPWAHLDIAGPANNDGAGFGFTGKGPTAITVRSLLALAEHFSRK